MELYYTLENDWTILRSFKSFDEAQEYATLGGYHDHRVIERDLGTAQPTGEWIRIP